MKNSKIEWCDHSFNPWIGCTKVSPGCVNCYAEVSTPARVSSANGTPLWGMGNSRRRSRTWSDPLRWNKHACEFRECKVCGWRGFRGGPVKCVCGEFALRPAWQRVFCASLADWLDDQVPIEWLADLLTLIDATPDLDWLLLTKRPENWTSRIDQVCKLFACDGSIRSTPSEQAYHDMLCPWRAGTPPQNVWLGTSIEDQIRANTRIPELLRIPAKIRFLSVEPMLEAIWVGRHLGEPEIECFSSQTGIASCCGGIGWVICGGESGRNRRAFNCDWARALWLQCRAAETPFFFKQVDKVRPIPADLQVRQFPSLQNQNPKTV